MKKIFVYLIIVVFITHISYGFCEKNIIFENLPSDIKCNTSFRLRVLDTQSIGGLGCDIYYDFFGKYGCWNGYNQAKLVLVNGLNTKKNASIIIDKDTHLYYWDVECKKEGFYVVNLTLSNETSYCTKMLVLNLTDYKEQKESSLSAEPSKPSRSDIAVLTKGKEDVENDKNGNLNGVYIITWILFIVFIILFLVFIFRRKQKNNVKPQ